MGDDLEIGLMPDFRTSPGGATVVLDEIESALLRQLTAELRALISGRRRRKDPVRDRLFPAAYERPEDESAYQEMTAGDLESEKLRALDAVSTALGDGPNEVELAGDDFSTWLACLTDLRLAIGTRLNVDEERMAAEVDPRDADAQAISVLHWLGWLQEGLLRAAAG